MGFSSRAGLSKKYKKPKLKPLFPKLAAKYPEIVFDHFGIVRRPAWLLEKAYGPTRYETFIQSERFRTLPRDIQEKILKQGR